ncbi:MAG: hypothetical protein HC896_01135 [Bacteroidales bacterium]|nr:hypothetical protein [Bacteroidales bacterium]
MILSIPVGAYFVLTNHKTQTAIINRVIDNFAQKIGTRLKLQSVNFGLFNKLQLNGLLIMDQQNDTLLYAEKLTVNIRRINRKTET